MSTAIAVRHQLSPPGGSSDTIVPNVTVSNSGAINSKMPHTNHNAGAAAASSAAPSSPGDDFGSTDEVKVFKDEGDKEDEQSSGENLLLEEKSSLIDLTESEFPHFNFPQDKSEKPSSRQDHSPVYSKDVHHPPNFTYLVSPYTYANGAASLPVSMANKIGIPTFFCHNGDHLTTPPPAHCGIPPYQIDPKTMGEFCLTRPSLYSFPNPQYAYPMLSPEMASTWHTPYSGPPFRPGYPSSLQINTSLSRFSPSLLPSVHQHVLNSHPHPALVSSGSKQDSSQESNHRYGRSSIEHHHNSKNSSSSIPSDSAKESIANDKKKPHIKKPLNAFMLYMKEMRAQVVAECTLKESAAINQILGRKWHALGREEQAKYYELARRERQLHMQMYPDWSSRTNATRGKKRKRKQEPNDGGNSMKKCRARYGLDQQNQWCKPCSPGLSILSAAAAAGNTIIPTSSTSSTSSSSSSSVHLLGLAASLSGSAGNGPPQASPQTPTYVNL